MRGVERDMESMRLNGHTGGFYTQRALLRIPSGIECPGLAWSAAQTNTKRGLNEAKHTLSPQEREGYICRRAEAQAGRD
jgi:hypothetical protein